MTNVGLIKAIQKRETDIKALTESIEKWERNTRAMVPYQATISSRTCALCEIYLIDGECTGCPVKNVTKRDMCADSPYQNAYHAYIAWSQKYLFSSDYIHKNESLKKDADDAREAFVEAAKKEIEFLKSILAALS